MSIQIIDNFELSLAKPIDNRFVVGSLSFYTNKDSIPLKYNGLRIYDTTDSTPYIWTGATWSYDIDRVSITLDNNTNSSHYITFVGATSGVNYVKTSDKGLKYNPLSSQVLLADGSVSLPTLSFSSSTNLGIYRVNSTTLGFASGGAKRFEISSTSATSSVNFNVSAISASGSPALRVSSNLINTTSYSNGAMSIGRSPSIGFPGTNFEFFPQSRNSYFYIATLSPLPIASSSGSSLTIEGSRISIYNARDNSGYTVRDAHYFNTETYEGFISMGNVGDNDQFQFHMNGRTAILGGGGLYIGNNLSVGGESSIGNSLTVGGALNVSGAASIMDNVSIGASSNTSIFSGSSLFNSSTPKLEVLVGNSISNYQELMVLRGLKGSATNNLTRVGVIMKLSDDLDSNESNKMGGMILESTTQYSNYPSLYLVTANQKRLGVTYGGDVSLSSDTSSTMYDSTFIGSASYSVIAGPGSTLALLKSITVPSECNIIVECTFIGRVNPGNPAYHTNKIMSLYNVSSIGAITQTVTSGSATASIFSSGYSYSGMSGTTIVYPGDMSTGTNLIEFYMSCTSPSPYTFNSKVYYQITIVYGPV